MYYNMDWNIEFNTDGQKHRLGLLAECEVFSSIDNLADTATIVLPEAVMNEILNFENKIKRGSEVLIQFGYDGNLETEFTGFIRDITTNDSSLKILCEDALFLFRVGVKDIELKPTSLKKIGQYLIDQTDPSFTIDCTYDFTYETFVIHQATAYDVLKKIQEESQANITFDTQNKVLHIHPAYIKKGGEVFYSLQQNIENSSLEFDGKLDAKTEVTIESTDSKGYVQKLVKGTTGGDKVTIKVGTLSKTAMEQLADSVLLKKTQPGYTGSFDTWLVPMVKPSYSARIKDQEYPEKTNWYYINTVDTNFSEAGGKRTITPGIKLN